MIRDQLQDRSLTKAQLMEISDEMEEIIGHRELIDNIELALDSDTLRDVLEYIARNFDI